MSVDSGTRPGPTTSGVTVCEACGASNPPGTSFCHTCRAFVGWDHTAVLPEIVRPPASPASPGPPAQQKQSATDRAEENVETRVLPKIIADPPPVADELGSVLSVRLQQAGVVVPVSGERVALPLMITNLSSIVDGYEVDAGGAPPWLKIDSGPLRLLPGQEGGLPLGFRVVSDTLVPAGRASVRLRVRSLTRPGAHEIVEVGVEVPVVDPPVVLRTEPSVMRLTDIDIGRFVVLVDNSRSNRPVEVRLSGTDPELAVHFHFDPPSARIGPGEIARVRAVTTSGRPPAGREVTRALTVSAAEGNRRTDATVTLVQATSAAVVDPPVELSTAPSLVRIRDGETGAVRVRIDNRAGRQPAIVRLTASDPELQVTTRWEHSEVRVPPAGTAEVEVRLSAPPPEPGTEVTRVVTLAAADGRRVVRAAVTMVHTASASPMTTLAVRLDPSVLRLGTGRRGAASVVVDNRRGRQTARVWLRGDDPENALRFAFTPAELTVAPGQVGTGRVAVTAPRPPAGRELSRPLTVIATDGTGTVEATGTVLQVAGDRRPWARVVLTLLGALVMIIGTMLPLRAVSEQSAFGVGADGVAGLFGASVDLGGFEQLASLGLVILVLAGLAVFGLTAPRGRLSRLAALLTATLTVGMLITVGLAGRSCAPGVGAVVIILGAALAYVGNLFVRR